MLFWVFLLVFLVFGWPVFLGPFDLLVPDRRCLFLTTFLGWLVKIPAQRCYVRVGLVWGGDGSSSFMQISCGSQLPLVCLRLKNMKIYWEVGYFCR